MQRPSSRTGRGAADKGRAGREDCERVKWSLAGGERAEREEDRVGECRRPLPKVCVT